MYYILVNLFLISRKTANWTPKATNEPTMEAKKVCNEIPVVVCALPAPESSALPMLVGCAMADEEAMVMRVAEEVVLMGPNERSRLQSVLAYRLSVHWHGENICWQSLNGQGSEGDDTGEWSAGQGRSSVNRSLTETTHSANKQML